MSPACSEKSLIEKLGIKQGLSIVVLNPPQNYSTTLGELPKDVTVMTRLEDPSDFIHFFTVHRKELEDKFPIFTQALSKNGILWISWPKSSSKVETDLNEDVVREIGLKNGLVDVKICAVDKTWSGLKFVYRMKDRP